MSGKTRDLIAEIMDQDDEFYADREAEYDHEPTDKERQSVDDSSCGNHPGDKPIS